MAKKRTFSDRRGDGPSMGGRRPRLSYSELEQRRRTVEGGGSGRGRSRPRDAGRGPTEMHPRPQSARLATDSRPKARRRRGLQGYHLVIGGAVILAAVILILVLVFVLPSPIGGLTPVNGSYVNTPNVEVKASIKRSFKPQDVTLKVDGKDVTMNMKVARNTVSSTVPLADGDHQAMLQINGGLGGKKTATWKFKVDSTAPKLSITSKKVAGTNTPGEVRVTFKGTADKGAVVTVADKPVTVDKNGAFTGDTVTSRAQSLKVSAKDGAGNVSNNFIVTQKSPAAKGIHVSSYMAASDTDLAKMIALIERTELNAVEVDLKDEAGQIGFNIDNPLAQQVKGANDWIKLDACVDQLRYKNVYSICRIVCFKDPKLAKGRPDLAVQDKAGGVWGKAQWLDPYSKEVWDYDLSVAEAAAKAGFNEVQFDYVRFPSDGNTKACLYPHQDARPPAQVIDDFLSYARERLAPYNVFVSADVFGLTASDQGDMNIGQSVMDVANRVDFISPMVYPSHYNLGEYQIKVPEANPGDTVTRSLEDFKKKMKGTQASLRPWLQDFSLKIVYTPDMVRRQIDATEALGIKQWLLWDPDCSYSEAALKPATKK